MGFRAKVSLVHLIGLMHLWVSLALVVLGRTGRGNLCGVHHGPVLSITAQSIILALTVAPVSADPARALRACGETARWCSRRSSGSCLHPAGKFLVQRDVVQRLTYGGVGVTKELLKQENSLHPFCAKRWPTGFARRRVSCDQRPAVARLICFIARVCQIRALRNSFLQTF